MLKFLSLLLAPMASVVAFGLWAYAGSEDVVLLIIFGAAPWVATVLLFREQLVAGGVAYLAAAGAMIFASAFRAGWGLGGLILAGVPLLLGAICLLVSSKSSPASR